MMECLVSADLSAIKFFIGFNTGILVFIVGLAVYKLSGE